MKKQFFFILFYIFSIYNFAFSQQSYCDDFVTIKGRYFNCGGSIFYPLLTAYGFDIVQIVDHATLPNQYFLSRQQHYGPIQPDAFEGSTEQEWTDQITHDLQAIHQMGFNGFRTHWGAGFEYRGGSDGFHENGSFLPGDFVQRSFCINCGWGGTCFKISTDPTVNDPFRARYFELMKQMLTIAHACSLKVIFDVGYGPITTPAHFADYKNYITLLGQFIHSLNPDLQKTLIAYAIVEEPQYEDQHGTFFNKYNICIETTQMYDALKGADPNHLITLGGGEPTSLIDWDLGVMKFDFISPHPYPNDTKFDYEGNNDQSVERVKRDIYWLYKNATYPWIIGETGFMAIDDWVSVFDPPGTPSRTKHFPDANGELETPINGEAYTQKKYAHDILEMVRNCNGAGFTWWEFQEEWEGDFGYGLLRHGEAFNDLATMKKPVVTEFESYLNSAGEPPTISSGGCPIPSTYYDSYLHTQLNPSMTGEIHGTVSNKYTQKKIGNAYVMGKVHVGVKPNGDDIYDSFLTYTYPNSSADEGKFSLVPYDYILPIENTFMDLQISAVGSERNERGENILGVNPSNLGISLNEDFGLASNLVNFDLNVEGVTISVPNNESYRAYSSINVNNVTAEPHSTTDFFSGNYIDIIDSHLEKESEVLFHIGPSWPNCSYYDPSLYLRLSSMGNSINNKNYSIELSFIKNGNLSVYPNPTSGITSVYFSNQILKNISLDLLNVYGEIINTLIVSNGQSIDLTYLPKGIYMLRSINNNEITSQKIILN
jgi:hypothetical protein